MPQAHRLAVRHSVHAPARQPAPPMQCWPCCTECRCVDEILPVNIAGGCESGLGAAAVPEAVPCSRLSPCVQLAEFCPPTVLGEHNERGHAEYGTRGTQTTLRVRRRLHASRRGAVHGGVGGWGGGGGLRRLSASLPEASTDAQNHVKVGCCRRALKRARGFPRGEAGLSPR